jgi:hypothetical protein
MKQVSRKSELRRLAAKQGWYAGRNGKEPSPPEKIVMKPNGNSGSNQVPRDEELAYWRGYEEGQTAPAGSQNP